MEFRFIIKFDPVELSHSVTSFDVSNSSNVMIEDKKVAPVSGGPLAKGLAQNKGQPHSPQLMSHKLRAPDYTIFCRIYKLLKCSNTEFHADFKIV